MARCLLFLVAMMAFLATMVSAFLPAAPLTSAVAGARTRDASNVVVMACRFNAKKEKRKRNNENARKYRMKQAASKFALIKTRKRASKAEYSKRLEQYESDFCARIYKIDNLDALLAGATSE